MTCSLLSGAAEGNRFGQQRRAARTLYPLGIAVEVADGASPHWPYQVDISILCKAGRLGKLAVR